MRNSIKAHSAILAANVIYGVNFIAVKHILPQYMQWQALAFFRGFGALFLIFITSFWFKLQKIERTDVWKLVVAGLLGITINQSLLVWGIELSSPVNASIIMTSNPLFVMVFSALILHFPITKTKIIGTILGGSGALILIFTSTNGSFSFANSIGDLIILTNSLMYGLYLVWIKPLSQKYDSFTVIFYTFLFGSIPVLFYGLKPAMHIDYSAIPTTTYVAIAFVVVCSTYLTYLLKIVGLKYVNPTTVSIYIYLQPIIATFIAVYIGSDSFSWYKILSMVLVFAGVYIVNLSNTKK